MASQEKAVANDVIQSCNESAAACTNCADNAQHEKCSKQCRINAELATLTGKFLSLGAPQLNSIIDLTLSSANTCAEVCKQHSSDHCKACAKAASNLQQSLRKYQEQVSA
ncbi:6563_t:CDS:2 [Entrophospora sp. SA101]|nr:10584_t:CDS:2 [Entrophospora candida]CAH1759766.1 5900_t:CDS:2 [Entrophospora sp. SA101]CAG8513394.1 77_t:CDS:2 [Entrophospora candida]CAJ0642223.1 15756_t:CDS:2 [Entrophospora sp. SA101]CAJ0752033.1 6563_t:CDS:2 [Entrophospora sp. SA101]